MSLQRNAITKTVCWQHRLHGVGLYESESHVLFSSKLKMSTSPSICEAKVDVQASMGRFKRLD